MQRKTRNLALHYASVTSERWQRYANKSYALICGEKVIITKDTKGCYYFQTRDHKSEHYATIQPCKDACKAYVYKSHTLRERIMSAYMHTMTEKRVQVYQAYIMYALHGGKYAITVDRSRQDVALIKTLKFFELEGFITYTRDGGQVTIEPLSELPYRVLVHGIGLVKLHNLKVELSVGGRRGLLSEYDLGHLYEVLGGLTPQQWLNPALLPDDTRDSVRVGYYGVGGTLNYLKPPETGYTV